MRPDPTKKLTDAQKEQIKLRYCAGEKGKEIIKDFPHISLHTIRWYAKTENWPTPARIRLAQSKPELLSTNDPAMVVASVWNKRKGEAREMVHDGMAKALRRFLAHSPTPTSFAEAKIAHDMLTKAIDPDAEKSEAKSNINLAILTQAGFEPKPARGRTL